MDELYCKIFIDTAHSRSELFNKLQGFLNGAASSFGYINTEWCEACLRNNSYYSEKEYCSYREDFVIWPYYLEIYNDDRSEPSAYIQNIKNLIAYLKNFCKGVAAACDFENSLKL